MATEENGQESWDMAIWYRVKVQGVSSKMRESRMSRRVLVMSGAKFAVLVVIRDFKRNVWS
jgi:hypothetical protein